MSATANHANPPNPTNEVSAASTSSINPATSKPFDDLTQLGDHIVAETGLATSTDTIGRWMAHHIAELMHTANAARGTPSEAAAGQACREAILALWQHRSSWPQGWPPPTAKIVADQLADAKGPAQMRWHRGTTLVAGFHSLHYQMLAALVDLLVGVSDTTTERSWLDQCDELLTDDERALLQLVADSPQLPLFADSTADNPRLRIAELAEKYHTVALAMAQEVSAVNDGPEEPDSQELLVHAPDENDTAL